MKIAAGLVVGLVCSAVFAGAPSSGPAQRTLSFDERVRAQAAIERVYYGHQLGAKKSFDEAVPRAVLEAKVHKYLDESAALDTYWKTAVTDSSLQRELERMAQGTKMPERLLELYAALGNDSFLIKECLARPVLVDRLTHNFYAFDPTRHTQARALADSIHEALVSGTLSPKADHPNRTVTEIAMGTMDRGPAPTRPSSQHVLTPDEFKTQRAELPAQTGKVSEITETREAFVLSVVLNESKTSARVATYVVPKTAWDAWWDASRDSVRTDALTAVASSSGDLPVPRGTGTTCADDGWDNGSLDDLPSGRFWHSSVWTGSQMIVWGGIVGAGNYTNTGGRYDPATDTWTSTTTIGAPSARPLATAVWTGASMVVWGGGYQFGVTSTGGRYDPVADSWSPTSTIGAPSPRTGHVAVWTGSVMVVWGGSDGPTTGHPANIGGRYDPVENSWSPTSTVGAPPAGAAYTVVWTGGLMVVWDGVFFRGGRYDPIADTWASISHIDVPTARDGYSAVWTGSRMVVWGGRSYVSCDCPEHGGHYEYVNTGALYDPVADTWTATSTVGAPGGRLGHSAVWTGSLMVISGGEYGLTPGGRYDPATDSWTPVSVTGEPSRRLEQSAVWTGSLMIVWGGQPPSTSNQFLNTGARYDPVADSWTPTSMTSAPSARSGHTAVWTGNLMVVWGGAYGQNYVSYYLDTGGRYDPAIDDWTPTSTTGAPSARSNHTAVWTGNLMVVWGPSETGGRYDPLADSWAPTSTLGAPPPRTVHTAVWTGSRMVVWGGYDGVSPYPNSGGRYDPVTDSWAPTSESGAPAGRVGHTALWTGSLMLVWGGYDDVTGCVNTGGRYDPETDSWAPTSLTGAPIGRQYHAAVWAGDRMVVWAGSTNANSSGTNTGGRYDPSNDSWTPTSTTGAPARRHSPVFVSTGGLLLVWHGYVDSPAVNTAGWYDPAADRWTKIPSTGEPTTFTGSAIWTGTSMIVWNGSTGGRYALGSSLDADCDGDGVSASAGDCDDHDATIYPGAPQLCDGVSNDCNDPAWPSAPLEDDFDQDGFRRCQGDCNDLDASVFPGAPQICDGLNNDCSDPKWPAAPNEADADHDGVRICQGDCDDTSRYIYPGAFEHCNGWDDDCDGFIDEGGDALCHSNDPCYTGVCGGLQGCSFNPNTAPCDDGYFCTGGDTCADGFCQGTPRNGTPCDDNNTCTTNDVCGGYLCRGTPTPGNACDDGQVCTTNDACGSDGWCHGGDRFDCDDGNVCNGDEVCYDYYGCVAGTPITCHDDNDCTDDSCDPVNGCVFTANTSACDDGNSCTSKDVCADGSCRGEPLPGNPCDDGNVCTTSDTCSIDGFCFGGPPRDCDDHNLCNGTETCYPYYGCNPGAPLNCHDTNPCTSDGCAPATGCVFTPNTDSCDDHDACTTGDACGGGGCHGRAIVCDDGNLCTADSCDPAVGCVFTNAVACDDGNPCSDDSCDPATGGCRYSNNDANACSDGDACTQTDSCHAGVCGGSNPVTCFAECPPEFISAGGLCRRVYDIPSDLLDNQDLACDDGVSRYNGCNHQPYGFHWMDVGAEFVGVSRVEVAFESGLSCDPGSSIVSLNGATLGSFNTVGSCSCFTVHGLISFPDVALGTYAVGGANAISITPNQNCEGLSKSQAFNYSFARVTVSYLTRSNACRVGVCDSGTGGCSFSDVPDGTACSDDNPCTAGDSCTEGTCGGTANGCDDNNPCTDDTCDPATGCVHTNNAATCDDGDACTTGNTCDGGVCHGGTTVVCNDKNGCTDDSCDSAKGCVFADNANSCDDGNACTTDDACGGGSCHGTIRACNDNNPCTTDSCNPATGCVYTDNTNSCDDGNGCTRIDTCVNGACVGGSTVACGPLDECHAAGACNPATGACSNPIKPDGTICDDASLCTTGETCQSGTCTPIFSGLNHPKPKSSGYYKQLCQRAEHGQVPYHGDQITDADALCVASLTAEFSNFVTAADLCAVIAHDSARQHEHPGDHDPYSNDCFKAEDELIATALNICRARVCEAQNVDSRCGHDSHVVIETTVGASFGNANAILDSPARTKDTCKVASCTLKEINNGRALEMNSVLVSLEVHAIRLSWLAMDLDDGSGMPDLYEVWRRPLNSSSAFTKIGTTPGLTFLDRTAGTAAWEYDITAVIPGD